MAVNDVMEVWRKLPIKAFFTIDGEVFQKNSATTALYVSNPSFGEIYIGPVQARAILPYTPPAGAAAPVAPKDPEVFETKVVPRPPTDSNFGATTIIVTPADSKVEQGIQPPANTGKRIQPKEDAVQPPVNTVQPPVETSKPIQPPANTGKRKKAKKKPDVPFSEDFGTPHLPEGKE